jgi:glycosyltransferase involved in cell wall biosynthesis
VSQSAQYILQGITCLIPNKNGASFIDYLEWYFRNSLDVPLEILIIDDKSTDTSLQMFKSWGERDSRVKILSNPGNGLVDALNFGIVNSSYDWIARFDMDDKYSPDRLKIQAGLLDDDVALIFSDYQFISPSGETFGLVPSPVHHKQIVLSLYSNRRTPHSSAVFSRPAAISAGMYKQEEFLAEDLGLWLRLSKLGRLQSSPEPLLKYRISSSSTLGQHREKALVVRNLIRSKFDFLSFADDASRNLRETRDSYYSLNLSDERFILHLLEIVEVYISNRKIVSLIILARNAFPLMRIRHFLKFLTFLRVRKRKQEMVL